MTRALYEDLTWRGLIHQSTDPDGLPGWLDEQPRTVYAGFDPTADSLHVGSLLPLLLLRRFQQAGHRPVALVGGATGMIGDPSGKSEERQLLSVEALQQNVAGLERQMRRFLQFEGPRAAVLVNNFDWMRSVGYLDFLREIGKSFPVNVMLAKDSVKGRLERADGGMSYTEFSYMLLQAYDFVYLCDQFDCRLQVGGSDQWGNITAGIDLARRMRGVQLFGLTCPLLLDTEGNKIGKTESGTKVWLSGERTRPHEFFQYLYNLPDADAGACLRFLTDLSHDEIESLDRDRLENPQNRASQTRLAEELTRLVHGAEGLEAARAAQQALFGKDKDPAGELDRLQAISGDVPSSTFQRADLGGDGIGMLDAFVAVGLAKTKGEVRRLCQQGGTYVNGHRESDPQRRLTADDLGDQPVILLQAGKKKHGLMRFEP